VWEVRVFVGNDDIGRPKQVSRTVRGTKRDAQRVAAELTVAPPPAADGRTVVYALEAWIETHTPTWAAPTAHDQAAGGDDRGRRTGRDRGRRAARPGSRPRVLPGRDHRRPPRRTLCTRLSRSRR
jgi:hypothetical protein